VADGKDIASSKHKGWVGGASWSEGESQVLSWGDDGVARVWGVPDGKEIASFEHKGRVWGASWSRDESRVLSWGTDGVVLVWGVADGKEIASFKHNGWVGGASWSKDESQILSWGSEDGAQVWGVRDGKTVVSFKYKGRVWGASWSGDCFRVLSWGDDGVRVWGVKDGKEIAYSKHKGPAVKWARVLRASWSRDESRVLSWVDAWLYNSVVQVWDLAVDPWLALPRSTPEEDLTLEVEALTGVRLNPAGEVEPLSRQEWLARKEQVRQIRAKAARKSSPHPAPFVSSSCGIDIETSPNRERHHAAPEVPLFALLVGIGKYASPSVPPLAKCVNDVDAAEQPLLARFGASTKHVCKLAAAATREAIEGAFRLCLIEPAKAHGQAAAAAHDRRRVREAGP
jgi:hypothetical protein